MHPEKLKCLDFLNLDFGKKVIGGSGPEGGPPITLPEGILHYYNEEKILHPETGADIRTYDRNLIAITDNTKIDGYMQDEQYILHRKEEICGWLRVQPQYNCTDYANDTICVINFRGGEYVGIRDVFLPQQYWDNAIANMRLINPGFKFIVITDDVKTAKKFFPNFPVHHFSIGKDYSIVNNAHYLILANSSFSFFPAWTNTNLKYCIAPKYWAQYNTSDGYWGLGYNITTNWMYQDRSGKLHTYEKCIEELKAYHEKKYIDTSPIERDTRACWLWRRNMERKIKKLIKIVVGKIHRN